MTRWALIAAALTLAAGCEKYDSDTVKDTVKQALLSNYDADFGEMQDYPGGVVCGEVDPIGRLETHEGFRPFIFVNGQVNMNPTEDDLAIFCSEDPAAQFEQRFGTIPASQPDSSLKTIAQHMNALDEALQAYLSDNRLLPLTHQGLDALVTATQTNPKPPNFRQGGYLQAIPVDPWGRPYRYTSEEVLRMEPRTYTLLTLGKDNAEGGTGEDADISNLHLKYLNHLDTL